MRWRRNVVIRSRPGARNVTLRLRERLFSGGRCVTCAHAANSTSFANSSQHHRHQHHHIQHPTATTNCGGGGGGGEPPSDTDVRLSTKPGRRASRGGDVSVGAPRGISGPRTGEMLQRATSAPSALAHDSRHQPVAAHLDTSPSGLHVI